MDCGLLVCVYQDAQIKCIVHDFVGIQRNEFEIIIGGKECLMETYRMHMRRGTQLCSCR